MKKRIRKLLDWELWPFYAIYAPLSLLWLYYAIRARAFWFVSNVNPTLIFSGLQGETKREMYGQLSSHLFPSTLFIPHKMDIKTMTDQLEAAAIRYPFIVKPDVGMQGLLIRKIENEDELVQYHTHVPVDYIIQEYVQLPMEFSVFHIRYPGQPKGKVTGFILKEYMHVTGNGVSTLRQLINDHPKAIKHARELLNKHRDNLEKILPAGEQFYLSFVGNHNRGARFINLHKEIDDRICQVFDTISLETGNFYFGRYDLKCTSIEDLKNGKNISILEFNGTGAEPNHIYDCGMNYLQALHEIARHWKAMFEIGRINLQRGVPYWNFRDGYKFLKNTQTFFTMLRKHEELHV